ncbi:MAG: hypothetical protein K0S78_965 [Thermomicrobiales bacterium]|jgi:hypothetical protein|nr:hypothetical protein [Thermomicrobiales bacterium]MDF3038143.1 hypothetical protein [Thermomicrobiales bacterium]
MVPFSTRREKRRELRRPIRVKEVMPMSSHGTEGITVEAARR